MNASRNLLMASTLVVVLVFALAGCNRQPTDQGSVIENQPPETALAPTPLEGSMNNSFKLRVEWSGKDGDGIVQGYEYRVDGPLYDNAWVFTEDFFVDFKFRNGWYTVEVRAVDNTGQVDATPAKRRFHVLGPTFDQGLLIVDDQLNGPTEPQTDAAIDSLMIAIGYSNYTVWDYQQKFATVRPVFAATENDTDATGEPTPGLGAFSTIIWRTQATGNLGLNEVSIRDFMDMGGNLLVTGINPIESLSGNSPNGTELSRTAISYRYFRVLRAKAVDLNVDLLLGWNGRFPDLNTKFQIPNTPIIQYLRLEATQLIPLPDAEILYGFSRNHYRDNARSIDINSEELAGTPCAIVYDGETFNSAMFGFPLVNFVRAGPTLVNLIDTQAIAPAVRYVLEEVFQEPK